MQSEKIRVAILIVNYNGLGYLSDCLQSIMRSTYSRIDYEIFIVDNASSDGSLEYLKKSWPMIHLISLPQNTGFAGGNNAGWETIRRSSNPFKYILLLNEDTLSDEMFLEPLVTFAEKHVDCASFQPLLLLHPETNKVNSLGNVIHYLGFGYSGYAGYALQSVETRPREINYASGAAVLLRCSVLEQIGLFEEFMFMYLEDLDLGWRIRLIGLHNMLVPQSRVYHKYEFQRGMRQYYYFERNRLWIIIRNYKLATLALLLPIFLIMELGQIMRAGMTGVFWKKMKSYAYFFSVKHMRYLLRSRKKIQGSRVVSDREIISRFAGTIEFQPLDSLLLKYIANPILKMYRILLIYCIRW